MLFILIRTGVPSVLYDTRAAVFLSRLMTAAVLTAVYTEVSISPVQTVVNTLFEILRKSSPAASRRLPVASLYKPRIAFYVA